MEFTYTQPSTGVTLYVQVVSQEKAMTALRYALLLPLYATAEPAADGECDNDVDCTVSNPYTLSS